MRLRLSGAVRWAVRAVCTRVWSEREVPMRDECAEHLGSAPAHVDQPRHPFPLKPVQLHSFVQWVRVGDWVEVGYGSHETELRIGQVYKIDKIGLEPPMLWARDRKGRFSVSPFDADVVLVHKLVPAQSQVEAMGNDHELASGTAWLARAIRVGRRSGGGDRGGGDRS